MITQESPTQLLEKYRFKSADFDLKSWSLKVKAALKNDIKSDAAYYLLEVLELIELN